MPLVIDPKQYILGPANIYYRALGVTTAWISIGSTTGDAVVRIPQTWFQPQLNGLLGPVQGLDYLVSQMAEAEFSMPEIAGAKFGLAVPGATSTVTLATDASSPAYTATTLAAAAAIGDTNIKVTAVTGAATGQFIRIDVTAGGLAEYRVIDTVGTLGAGGTGISFRDPLVRAHASGVAVVQSNGTGDTVITGGGIRRQPDTAYNQWAIVAPSGTGYYQFIMDSAISITAAPELTYGDASMAAIRVTLQARYNGATTSTAPWRLIVPS